MTNQEINDSAPNLLREVKRFREWADNFPGEKRFGEWECDYENWQDTYKAVSDFLANQPLPSWDCEETAALLYIIARDNETQQIAGDLRLRFPETLSGLTQAAITNGEADARWQLAEELGWLEKDKTEIESLLLILARDDDEYTRRRALRSLLRIGSFAVEALAIDAWNRPDPNQQWARMMALYCLYKISSRKLAPLLTEALQGEFPYLREYAMKIQQGTLVD